MESKDGKTVSSKTNESSSSSTNKVSDNRSGSKALLHGSGSKTDYNPGPQGFVLVDTKPRHNSKSTSPPTSSTSSSSSSSNSDVYYKRTIEDNISKFTLQHKLGTGAFGCVWRAVHNETKKLVVIKQISTKNDCRFVFNEKTILERLNTNKSAAKYIPRFQCYFCDKDNDYIVLECLDSFVTLGQYVRDGKFALLSYKQMQLIILRIIEAIEYLHANNVVHRDIKAENIMLDIESLEIRVIDFGFSIDFGECSTRFLEKEEVWRGSAPLMGPEIILYDEKLVYDAFVLKAADIWSLGATIIDVISGKTIFDIMNIHGVDNIVKFWTDKSNKIDVDFLFGLGSEGKNVEDKKDGGEEKKEKNTKDARSIIRSIMSMNAEKNTKEKDDEVEIKSDTKSVVKTDGKSVLKMDNKNEIKNQDRKFNSECKDKDTKDNNKSELEIPKLERSSISTVTNNISKNDKDSKQDDCISDVSSFDEDNFITDTEGDEDEDGWEETMLVDNEVCAYELAAKCEMKKISEVYTKPVYEPKVKSSTEKTLNIIETVKNMLQGEINKRRIERVFF